MTPPDHPQLVGFHLIAAPAAGPLAAEELYRHGVLFDRVRGLYAKFANGGGGFMLQAIDAQDNPGKNDFRPVLRGAKRTTTYRVRQPGGDYVTDILALELRENGLVSFAVMTTQIELGVSMRWVLVEIANALRVISRLRRLAEAPDAEYLLEVTLRADQRNRDLSLGPLHKGVNLGLLNQEERFTGVVPTNPATLPRYLVRDEAGFGSLFELVARDLNNLVGRAADVLFDPIEI
jgi:hypothetical protein